MFTHPSQTHHECTWALLSRLHGQHCAPGVADVRHFGEERVPQKADCERCGKSLSVLPYSPAFGSGAGGSCAGLDILKQH